MSAMAAHRAEYRPQHAAPVVEKRRSWWRELAPLAAVTVVVTVVCLLAVIHP